MLFQHRHRWNPYSQGCKGRRPCSRTITSLEDFRLVCPSIQTSFRPRPKGEVSMQSAASSQHDLEISRTTCIASSRWIPSTLALPQFMFTPYFCHEDSVNQSETLASFNSSFDFRQWDDDCFDNSLQFLSDTTNSSIISTDTDVDGFTKHLDTYESDLLLPTPPTQFLASDLWSNSPLSDHFLPLRNFATTKDRHDESRNQPLVLYRASENPRIQLSSNGATRTLGNDVFLYRSEVEPLIFEDDRSLINDSTSRKVASTIGEADIEGSLC